MKKILFITSTFPRSENEAVAKWIGELAVKLKRSGIDISVFAPSSRGLSSHVYHGVIVNRFRYAPKSLEILTQDEGAVFKIRNNPLLFFLVPLFFLFGSLNLIRHLIKNHYDVVHVHWPFPMGFLGLVAKGINKGKLVQTFYGAEFALVKKIPFGRSILKIIIKSADETTAISRYTASLVKEACDVPVSIIPFTSGFSSKRVSDKPTPKQKKTRAILYVGRLIERKGVKYLIRAMPKVLQKVDAKLEIVGGGPLSKQLKRLVIGLGLEKRINFTGKISDKRLINLYANCDVFVLPSIKDRWGDTEGLGVVLLEAMGFGKPVIASKIGGITDIIKHGYSGLLVKQKSANGLAKAITKVMLDSKLSKTLSENGFKYVKENFNWDAIVRKTKRLYV